MFVPAPRPLAVFAPCPPCLLYAHAVPAMCHAPRPLRVVLVVSRHARRQDGSEPSSSASCPLVAALAVLPFMPSHCRSACVSACQSVRVTVRPAGFTIAVLPSVVASRVAIALLAVMLDASLLARRFSRCLAACARQRTVPACSPSSALMGRWRVLPSLERRLPAVRVVIRRAMPYAACARSVHHAEGNAVSAGHRL